jgi:hypothetical protein
MHAAGTDLAALNLGHRISHCGCPDGYELIDDGIVRLRLRGLYDELANRQADQARRAALKAHRAALMELEPLR